MKDMDVDMCWPRTAWWHGQKMLEKRGSDEKSLEAHPDEKGQLGGIEGQVARAGSNLKISI